MTHLPDPISPVSGFELAPGALLPWAALRFTFSRSGGPGGQNVNKLATRAQLRVPLAALAAVLSPQTMQRLTSLAGRRVTDLGELAFTSAESRSQQANKQACLERLRELVRRALAPPKPRRPTRPTAGSRRRRVAGKRHQAQTKQQRRGVGEE